MLHGTLENLFESWEVLVSQLILAHGDGSTILSGTLDALSPTPGGRLKLVAS
jgi:hypothetical protein